MPGEGARVTSKRQGFPTMCSFSSMSESRWHNLHVTSLAMMKALDSNWYWKCLWVVMIHLIYYSWRRVILGLYEHRLKIGKPFVKTCIWLWSFNSCEHFYLSLLLESHVIKCFTQHHIICVSRIWDLEVWTHNSMFQSGKRLLLPRE